MALDAFTIVWCTKASSMWQIKGLHYVPGSALKGKGEVYVNGVL